jgi:stearoyl-CoA desaturase (delta-9 desaturase)
MTSLSLSKQKLNWSIIGNLAIHHFGAILAPLTFSWNAVAIALFLHWVTGGLGITLAYHRLLTHRSFKTDKWLEYVLVTLGSLALQGGPIEWVGLHRIHHLHSDTIKDPHDSNKGFWWSHMRWLFDAPPPDAQEQIRQLTTDLNGYRYYEFLHQFYWVPQIFLAAILYVCGGWSFVVWGIFVRLVLTYHTTWLVNSATHKYGYRLFDCSDRSTNCWWVALIAYGEGWHNNHHAYPHSARHGLKWWEFDLTWISIQTLKLFGLARNIRTAKAPSLQSD